VIPVSGKSLVYAVLFMVGVFLLWSVLYGRGLLVSDDGPPSGSFAECLEDVSYKECQRIYEDDLNGDGILQRHECQIFAGKYAELFGEPSQIDCDEFPE